MLELIKQDETGIFGKNRHWREKMAGSAHHPHSTFEESHKSSRGIHRMCSAREVSSHALAVSPRLYAIFKSMREVREVTPKMKCHASMGTEFKFHGHQMLCRLSALPALLQGDELQRQETPEKLTGQLAMQGR